GRIWGPRAGAADARVPGGGADPGHQFRWGAADVHAADGPACGPEPGGAVRAADRGSRGTLVDRGTGGQTRLEGPGLAAAAVRRWWSGAGGHGVALARRDNGGGGGGDRRCRPGGGGLRRPAEPGCGGG